MPCLLSYFVFEFLHRVLSTSTSRPFLPAAKQSGPRTVRVVAVVDYFEVMTSKVKVNSFFAHPINHGGYISWYTTWYLFLPCLRYVSCPAG